MENMSHNEMVGGHHSQIPEYQLAGRYVKRFLEVRTEGRRVHSWDHTLFVVANALTILDAYYKEEKSSPSEDEMFSVYIASLLHDVIQPDDVRNEELRKKMQLEWDMDVEGSEHSEGIKAFYYIVDKLSEKLSSHTHLEGQQKILVEKLIANKDRILNTYLEKENKNLSELPWHQRSVASRSLSLSDLYGNLNPDMVVKYGTYLSSDNVKKSAADKISVARALDMLIDKVFLDFINKPAADAKAKTHFSYNVFHNPIIVADWKNKSPEVMEDFELFVRYIKLLKDERDTLASHANVKKVCEENGLGIFGMFTFWHREGEINPMITSQEVFEKYVTLFSKNKTLAEVIKKEHLSEEEIHILKKLQINGEELMRDITKWQKKLANAEQMLGQKI